METDLLGRPSATEGRPRPPVAQRRRKRAAQQRVTVLVLLAPYCIALVAFGLAPALYGLWTSFNVTEFAEPSRFSLTQNWTSVAQDYRLLTAVKNVATYLVMWLPALLLTITSLALLLHARPGRLSALARLTYFVPGAVTGSAASVLWLFMISPTVSPVRSLLNAAGIEDTGQALAGYRLPAVLALMGVAMTAGGWIVIIYGAFVHIPIELLEAARVDKASAWQIAWYIKLPLVRSYLALVLITSFAAGTQVFVEPTVLGVGAIGQVSPTWSVNQLAYSYATQDANFGKAAALSMLLLLVGLVVAVIVITRTGLYKFEGQES